MPRSYASLPGVSGMLLVILIASDRSLQSTAWQLNTNLEPSATGSTLHRRHAIERMVSGAAVLGGLGGGLGTVHAAVPSNGLTFDSYRVVPDSTAALNPSLLPIQKADFLQTISSRNGGALWLGEHHNSVKDHNLQVDILRQVHQLRQATGSPTAVGLEQVQIKFQPVLNDYLAGKISAAEMRQRVEWDTRWMWPFEVYEPVFATAKELRMPLVALNVNSEDLALVEKGGLPGLPSERLRQYISDAPGFAAFAKPREFGTYVDYVIRPSYDLHEAMGLLKYSMSGEKLDEPMPFRNFFSGRILWDEAMANAAYSWTKANPGGLLVGLVGADHVKFRNGIPGRYARLAPNDAACVSVLLNPTLIDTRPSGTVGMEGAVSDRPETITLQIRYLKDDVQFDSPERTLPSSTGGVLALADYLVVG
jgi:hypothetical protein